MQARTYVCTYARTHLRMHRRTHRWTHGRTHLRTDACTHGHMDMDTHTRTHSRTAGRLARRADARADRRTGRRTDACMDARTHGRTDAHARMRSTHTPLGRGMSRQSTPICPACALKWQAPPVSSKTLCAFVPREARGGWAGACKFKRDGFGGGSAVVKTQDRAAGATSYTPLRPCHLQPCACLHAWSRTSSHTSLRSVHACPYMCMASAGPCAQISVSTRMCLFMRKQYAIVDLSMGMCIETSLHMSTRMLDLPYGRILLHIHEEHISSAGRRSLPCTFHSW